ncbi:MAG: paraquat-inducible protein A [Gammaproteobacteria bacterium]|uniref:Paraquat-inducible protein A n=1 Tax=Candidatus Thiopontia autotrophica TaxID=2841688 RepID=A0A8J6TVS2_9GAMM|nr:paraquat-inducible protein A [Candidatus Thiopontia autotrophica]MBL6969034.1 paraquat-inducible protein A [Gammaproteobacteria bacterium]
MDDSPTALQHSLVQCHVCGRVTRLDSVDNGKEGAFCPRCDTSLRANIRTGLLRSWTLVVTASVFYVFANIYPIITVKRFGRGEPDTIISGVSHLIEEEMYLLAVVIFVASIVVPLMKLLTLTYLLISVGYSSTRRRIERTRMYRIIEGIGHWSMVDIFVLATLVALVDLGYLATVHAGLGAVFFALVIVTSRFAVWSFNPKLIWSRGNRA